jgi:type II secretory pathway pseudopilin PulG
MTVLRKGRTKSQAENGFSGSPEGFTLVELLIATMVLIAASAAAFGLLAEIQRTAGYQAEVQLVINNTRVAMQAVERYIRRAGNDPHSIGLCGITIVGASEVQIRSDITGSSGKADPNKGDPDGDLKDSGEDITIRYNDRTKSLEVVPGGGPAQIVAGYISEFTMEYYDADGNITTVGSDVRTVAVTIAGSSLQPNPRTRRLFGLKLSGNVRVLT